jgi:hypothetical protein
VHAQDVIADGIIAGYTWSENAYSHLKLPHCSKTYWRNRLSSVLSLKF